MTIHRPAWLTVDEAVASDGRGLFVERVVERLVA
jgi:hypothetical protein